MKTLVFIAALLASTFANAAVEPAQRESWVCQATDYQGSFGTGYGDSRQDATADAIQKCMARSRTACSLQSCIKHN